MVGSKLPDSACRRRCGVRCGAELDGASERAPAARQPDWTACPYGHAHTLVHSRGARALGLDRDGVHLVRPEQRHVCLSYDRLCQTTNLITQRSRRRNILFSGGLEILGGPNAPPAWFRIELAKGAAWLVRMPVLYIVGAGRHCACGLSSSLQPQRTASRWAAGRGAVVDGQARETQGCHFLHARRAPHRIAGPQGPTTNLASSPVARTGKQCR